MEKTKRLKYATKHSITIELVAERERYIKEFT